MLHLQEMVKQGQQNRDVDLSERLPYFIFAPCHVHVHFKVEAVDDFYLIHLHVNGSLHIQCQRCLDEFNFPYDNSTTVAICRDEKRAEKILEHYECLVSSNFQINLEDILVDELHLYAPQFHTNVNDCSREINQFLTGKSDSY